MPSFLLAYKWTVGIIIQWTSSFTDDVFDGNRRTINYWHTEVCHLRRNMYISCVTIDAVFALLSTVPAVLADSMLHCFLLRVGRQFVHIEQCASESVQSCDDSKLLLQGEKQQQFYLGGNFIALCKHIFLSRYAYFTYILRINFI